MIIILLKYLILFCNTIDFINFRIFLGGKKLKIILKEINVNEKLSYENHIYLYLFSRFIGKDLSYEQLVFDDSLINQYNNFIKDPLQKQKLLNFLQSNNLYITEFYKRFQTEPWKYVKPIVWNDRDKSDYFIENLSKSHRFEVYIEKLLEQKGLHLGLFYSRDEQYNQGENILGIEIKRDIQSLNTGNLYFEYEERLKLDGKWVKSGILKDDNTRYFLIGDINQFYIFKKSDLINIYNYLITNNTSPYDGIKLKEARRGTSRGFIIPIETAKKISITIDQLVFEIQN